MAIRPDKDVLNEHAKFTKFDKYKQKPEIMKVADISQQDIDARGLRGFKKYNLETIQELGLVNPTLTEDELETLKKSKDVKPTGKYKET